MTSGYRVRVCGSRRAARFIHCICWRLAKRLLMTAFTDDSASHEEIRSPARYRSPWLIRLLAFEGWCELFQELDVTALEQTLGD